MGDRRYEEPYDRVKGAEDRRGAITGLDDAEVLQALAGASRGGDAYLANILATEALNRHRRNAAWCAAIAMGAGAAIVLRTLLLLFFAAHPDTWADDVVLLLTSLVLLAAGFLAFGVYRSTLRRGMKGGV